MIINNEYTVYLVIEVNAEKKTFICNVYIVNRIHAKLLKKTLFKKIFCIIFK